MKAALTNYDCSYQITTLSGNLHDSPRWGIEYFDGYLWANIDNDLLKPRASQVMTLGALGLTEAETGKHLFMSTDTVKTHRKESFSILGTPGMTEAITPLFEHDILEIATPASRSSLPLTDRGLEVIRWLSVVENRSELADALGIAELTVKSHLARCYKKARVSGAAGLVLLAHLNQSIVPGELCRENGNSNITAAASGPAA